MSQNAFNALEPASLEMCPDIDAIKKELMQSGALCAMMSGSGSAVFGIFSGHNEAKIAKDKLSEKYAQTYIAKPIK